MQTREYYRFKVPYGIKKTGEERDHEKEVQKLIKGEDYTEEVADDFEWTTTFITLDILMIQDFSKSRFSRLEIEDCVEVNTYNNRCYILLIPYNEFEVLMSTKFNIYRHE